jgi:hypothetical protein
VSGQLPAIRYAERAAEAVRSLNHATIRSGGYEWPADVYVVVGDLAVLAGRLPQALEQAGRWMQRAAAAGRVGHDAGVDPAAAVANVLADLDEAIVTADRLARLLGVVQSATSHLSGADAPEGTTRNGDVS